MCSIADGCEYWTFGDEDDETKCWLKKNLANIILWYLARCEEKLCTTTLKNENFVPKS